MAAGALTRRVLLVEDDAALASATERGLLTDGWEVVWRRSGHEALELVAQSHFDLVILDIGLPDIDGFAVCQRLAGEGMPPIAMLTARDEVADRVKGLEAGAEDYIVKPFAIAELIARSNAVIRRRRIRAGKELRAGGLRLEPEARRAWCNDEQILLTPSEWNAVLLLLPRLEKLVSRDELQEAIATDGCWLSNNALEAHVSRLRTKLKDARLTLRSVRGAGYILEAENVLADSDAISARGAD